ncbi:MAG TPA: HEAT repeat domain-containing protein [Desulfatiglandales bacterium]|nr:HEAT repeat domain-containing protein [Desulfatiglandales bacterium]
MTNQKAKELEEIASNTNLKDSVRIEACKQLGNLGSDGAESLGRIAKNTNLKDEVRMAALKGLGKKD